MHSGFAVATNPPRFYDLEPYHQYLDTLSDAITQSHDNGDLVIFHVGSEQISKNQFLKNLNPDNASVVVATYDTNPTPIAYVKMPSGNVAYQRI